MGKNKVAQYKFQVGNQTDNIVHALKLLGLDTTAASFTNMAEKVYDQKGTHIDFLEQLLNMEFDNKEENRVRRWTQMSKIPMLTTIKDYEFERQPNLDPTQIKELASCRFIDAGKNVVFLGPSGVGKTHLSCAIGIEAIRAGKDVRYMKMNEYAEAVRRRAEDAVPKLQNALLSPALLILDDVDYYATDKNAGKFLFDIVKRRYEDGKSFIFIANNGPETWGEFFGGPNNAPAAVDRILDRRLSRVINIKGGSSYRVPMIKPENSDEPVKQKTGIVRQLLRNVH